MKRWKEAGIQWVEDLIINSQTLSFEDIQNFFNIPSKDIFIYIRVSTFLKHCSKPALSLPPAAWQFLTNNKPKNKGISMFYSLLQIKQTFFKTSLMHLWELDLHQSFSEDQWLKAIKYSQHTTHCINHWENPLPVIHDPEPHGKVLPRHCPPLLEELRSNWHPLPYLMVMQKLNNLLAQGFSVNIISNRFFSQT